MKPEIELACFTCNKRISRYWTRYCEYIQNGYTTKEALAIIKFKRFCCRRMFITTMAPMIIRPLTSQRLRGIELRKCQRQLLRHHHPNPSILTTTTTTTTITTTTSGFTQHPFKSELGLYEPMV